MSVESVPNQADESHTERRLAHSPINIENTVLVDRPELPAVYKFIYSHHDRQNNPKALSFPEGQKPDCIALERGRIPVQEERIEGNMYTHAIDHGQYEYPIKYAMAQGIPLYFIDYAPQLSEEMERDKMSTLVVPALTMTGALGLIASVFEDLAGNKRRGATPIGRREYLKRTLKLAGASYLSLPMVHMATFSSDEIDEHAPMRKLRRKTDSIVKTVHPWLKNFKVEGRNIIFAAMLEQVSKDVSESNPTLNHKPNVPFIVGSEHFGVESEIGKDKETLKSELVKYAGNDFLGNLGSIVKVNFFRDDEDEKYKLKFDFINSNF